METVDENEAAENGNNDEENNNNEPIDAAKLFEQMKQKFFKEDTQLNTEE